MTGFESLDGGMPKRHIDAEDFHFRIKPNGSSEFPQEEVPIRNAIEKHEPRVKDLLFQEFEKSVKTSGSANSVDRGIVTVVFFSVFIVCFFFYFYFVIVVKK